MESPTRIPRVVPSQVTWDNDYKGIFLSPILKTSDFKAWGTIARYAKWREGDFCDDNWRTFFQNFHGVGHAVWRGPRRPRCALCHRAQGHAWLPDSGRLVISWRLQMTWFRKLPSWLALKVYSKAGLTTFYSVVPVGFPLVSICILPRLPCLPGEVTSAFPATKRCAGS